ncbi:MAG TPA: hypothetical protein DEO85_16325 [Maritimibacter sp.]|nr:hypothetical protein [Maritimibacter sp.]
MLPICISDDMQDTTHFIRPATARDIPRIETLHYLTWQEHRTREEGFDTAPFIETYTASVTHPDDSRAIVVAERRGQFAGYAAISVTGGPLKGRRLGIDDLAVLPQHQGHGLGRTLLDTVLANRPRRTTVAMAMLWPRNVAARDLLLKAGFEERDIGARYKAYRRRL